MNRVLVLLCAVMLPQGSAWCACNHEVKARPAPGDCCGHSEKKAPPPSSGHDAGSCTCPSMQRDPLIEHPVSAWSSAQQCTSVLPAELVHAVPAETPVPAIFEADTGPPRRSSTPIFLLDCALLR